MRYIYTKSPFTGSHELNTSRTISSEVRNSRSPGLHPAPSIYGLVSSYSHSNTHHLQLSQQYFYFHFLVCICMPREEGGGRGQKRSSQSLELESQVAVSCLAWTLGTQLRPLRKQHTLLATEPSVFPASVHFPDPRRSIPWPPQHF